MFDVDQILAAISELSPRDQERLWRRAWQMGLLTPASLKPAQKPPASTPTSIPRSVVPPVQPPEPAAGAQRSDPAGHRLTLVFDGGSKGNPGQGYGSYALDWNGRSEPASRLTFPGQMTNNEAEYDVLLAALSAIQEELQQRGIDPTQVDLTVRGDSKLVISQVQGTWQAREPRLLERRDRVRSLLKHFGRVRLEHHPRSASVAVLGH